MFWLPLLVAGAGCGASGGETSGSLADAGAERTHSDPRSSDEPAPGEGGNGPQRPSDPTSDAGPPPDPGPNPASSVAPEVDAGGAAGSPEVPPAQPSPSEPSPSQPSPSEPSGSGEFIPWSEFADAATFGLGSNQRIRSVVAHTGYDGGALVLAVSSDTGNNEVLAVNVEERSLRQLWFHRDCGDCRVGSSGLGVLLANGSGLWESTDGGYRFAELGSWEIEGDATAEMVAGFRPWTLVGARWRFIVSYDETRVADWPTRVVSVDSDSALELSPPEVRIHAAVPVAAPNPCASVPEAYRWGGGWHWGHAVIVSCGDSTIAFSPDLSASDDFVEIELDAPALSLETLRSVQFYAGILGNAQPPVSEMSVLIATSRSWYVLEVATAELSRVADQAEGPAGEHVVGYLDDQGTRGLRVSEQGIAVSTPFTP